MTTVSVHTPEGNVGKEMAGLAASPAVLAGKTIGLLDNRKPNAGLLLGRIGQRLSERTGATVAVVEQKNAALAAPDAVMGRLIDEVELVLTGSAD